MWSTMEYIYYWVIFLLYFILSQSASIDLTKSFSTSTSSSVDVLTTNIASSSGSERDIKLKHTLEECNNTLSWICIKLEFVRLLELLTERGEIHLLKGISLVKDPMVKEIRPSKLMAEISRSYPKDPEVRLNGYIVKKVRNYLQTHYLRFKLIDDGTIAEAGSLVEIGRKYKYEQKAGMEGLIAAGFMMKGTLMAIGMGGIALVAGKALITALMALTMATVVGLKSLGGDGSKSQTYEIVAKPIYTSGHTHSTSYDEGGHLGYSGTSAYDGYARTLNLNLLNSLRGSIKVK